MSNQKYINEAAAKKVCRAFLKLLIANKAVRNMFDKLQEAKQLKEEKCKMKKCSMIMYTALRDKVIRKGNSIESRI